MRFNLPKNDSKYYWTQHCIRKMLFYGLTADKVKRVIKTPKRIESGVAENTIAVMSSGANRKKPTEIWVMYSLSKKASTLSETSTVSPSIVSSGSNCSVELRSESKGKSFGGLRTISQTANRKIIISAWRYPGISPVGRQIPIPANILEELKGEGIIK